MDTIMDTIKDTIMATTIMDTAITIMDTAHTMAKRKASSDKIVVYSSCTITFQYSPYDLFIFIFFLK